eukprot:GFUD01043198.1.p1 GENE.GFUD01043198.1~~GFUD01043198.1.p1  ORF type:complete len:227 (+),score=33.64 GFUD01043198.1:188-868(+)
MKKLALSLMLQLLLIQYSYQRSSMDRSITGLLTITQKLNLSESNNSSVTGLLNDNVQGNIEAILHAFIDSIVLEDKPVSGKIVRNYAEENSTDTPLKLDKDRIVKLKSSKLDNNKEEQNSEYDKSLRILEDLFVHLDKLQTSINSFLQSISHPNFEVSGPDDKKDAIEGRLNTSDHEEKEQPTIVLPADKTAEKKEKGMCAHIETMRERLRCTVFACFKDNDYCYQ